MDEALLIEIAQRRRKLEDVIERADKVLKSSEEYHDRQCRNYCDVDSMSARQHFERHSLASIRIQENRAAIEQCAEACRDDMNRMADEIRKQFDPARPIAVKSIP